MNANKREHLEAHGWRVGSTQEFLGLSEAEMAYVDLKLALSSQLRTSRQEQHVTQREVARLLHSSQSRVAKMETGDPSVSLDSLVRSLLALGITAGELARVIALREPASAT